MLTCDKNYITDFPPKKSCYYLVVCISKSIKLVNPSDQAYSFLPDTHSHSHVQYTHTVLTKACDQKEGKNIYPLQLRSFHCALIMALVGDFGGNSFRLCDINRPFNNHWVGGHYVV